VSQREVNRERGHGQRVPFPRLRSVLAVYARCSASEFSAEVQVEAGLSF
jgi:hypothetical protein